MVATNLIRRASALGAPVNHVHEHHAALWDDEKEGNWGAHCEDRLLGERRERLMKREYKCLSSVQWFGGDGTVQRTDPVPP